MQTNAQENTEQVIQTSNNNNQQQTKTVSENKEFLDETVYKFLQNAMDESKPFEESLQIYYKDGQPSWWTPQTCKSPLHPTSCNIVTHYNPSTAAVSVMDFEHPKQSFSLTLSPQTKKLNFPWDAHIKMHVAWEAYYMTNQETHGDKFDVSVSPNRHTSFPISYFTDDMYSHFETDLEYWKPKVKSFHKDYPGVCVFVSTLSYWGMEAGAGHKYRTEFLTKLSELVPFYSFGKFKHNAEPVAEDESVPAGYMRKYRQKIDTLQRCKFYLAFENHFLEDYVTEKFFQGFLLNDTVMIYMGPESVKSYFPEMDGNYILGTKMSIDEMAQTIHHLLKTEKDYLRYTNWRREPEKPKSILDYIAKQSKSNYAALKKQSRQDCSYCYFAHSIRRARKTLYQLLEYLMSQNALQQEITIPFSMNNEEKYSTLFGHLKLDKSQTLLQPLLERAFPKYYYPERTEYPEMTTVAYS